MPSHTEAEKKKNRERIERLREEGRVQQTTEKTAEGGREFVGLREKALSRGATREQAVSTAASQVTGKTPSRTVAQTLEATEQVQQQRIGEVEAKQPFLEAVREDALIETDRLQNLARAGIIPFANVIEFGAKAITLGTEDFEITERTQEQISKAPLTREIFAAVGKATTAGVTVGGVKISIASLFGRRSEISALTNDASNLREISEATLRSTRDSQDYATGIEIYEVLIESNRVKHSNIQELLRDDPNSVEAGVTDAASALRDQNRLIGDKGILERALITGDPSELNRAVIALDLKGGA